MIMNRYIVFIVTFFDFCPGFSRLVLPFCFFFSFCICLWLQETPQTTEWKFTRVENTHRQLTWSPQHVLQNPKSSILGKFNFKSVIRAKSSYRPARFNLSGIKIQIGRQMPLSKICDYLLLHEIFILELIKTCKNPQSYYHR